MNCFETTGSWLSSNRIIMPMSSRTDGLDPKNQTGGERGIRTLDTLLEYARFPGVCLQPLGHLSAGKSLWPSAPHFSIQKSSCLPASPSSHVPVFCSKERYAR